MGKTNCTNPFNAKKQPLRYHEDMMVFYKKQPTYNPQKTTGHKPVNSYTKNKSDGANYGKTKKGISGGGSTERYPRSIWKYATDKQKNNLHPTQKPIALIEEIIKTYSNEGDTVLDNVAGSGTTGEACILHNRNFILIEGDPEHIVTIKDRLSKLKNDIEYV